MEEGLPLNKVINYYKDTENAAKQTILDRYSFCEHMKSVSKRIENVICSFCCSGHLLKSQTFCPPKSIVSAQPKLCS